MLFYILSYLTYATSQKWNVVSRHSLTIGASPQNMGKHRLPPEPAILLFIPQPPPEARGKIVKQQFPSKKLDKECFASLPNFLKHHVSKWATYI